MICLMIGGVLKKFKVKYLPESAACIMFGFLVGVIGNFSSAEEGKVLSFEPNIFFFILLPPIIFDAGYTLKRKDFFANFGSILVYAVFGTLITNLTFGYFLYLFAYLEWIPLSSANPLECLLFGAVISATDPVATLAMLNAKEVKADPLLYSLIFGESVLNDAIAIVLYQAFEPFVEALDLAQRTGGEIAEFGIQSLFKAIGNFFLVSLGSILVGVGVALLCSFIFRHINFQQYPVYEFTLVFLFAYMSYFLGEIVYTSGIMALFFCSVCLAHYNFYNISPNAQIATHEAFRSVCQICETFVFAYIGITAGLSISASHLSWSFPLIIVAILGCLLGRAFHVFPLSYLVNRSRRVKIPFKMQIPLWFAGLRGAVAFALALGFPGSHGKFVVTSTLVLVIFTTIVMGGLTLPVLKLTGMAGVTRPDSSFTLLNRDGLRLDDNGDEREQIKANVRLDKNGNLVSPAPVGQIGIRSGEYLDFARDTKDIHSSIGFERRKYSPWVRKFKQFDRTFMRKWFGGRPDRKTREQEAMQMQSIGHPASHHRYESDSDEEEERLDEEFDQLRNELISANPNSMPDDESKTSLIDGIPSSSASSTVLAVASNHEKERYESKLNSI